MKRLLLFAILAISMLGCNNPNKGTSIAHPTTKHDVDYSKLIELTAVEGGMVRLISQIPIYVFL